MNHYVESQRGSTSHRRGSGSPARILDNDPPTRAEDRRRSHVVLANEILEGGAFDQLHRDRVALDPSIYAIRVVQLREGFSANAGGIEIPLQDRCRLLQAQSQSL
jgi:hypothetical protein